MRERKATLARPRVIPLSNEPPVRSVGAYVLNTLQTSVWVIAVALLLHPVASLITQLAAVACVITAAIVARRFSRLRISLVVIIASSFMIGGLGMLMHWFVGQFAWPSKLLGPERVMLAMDLCLFAPLTFATILVLRSLSIRYRWLTLLESFCILACVVFSFRAHRAFPFSQPQWLSDWAFVNGHDPRNIIIWIGVISVIGAMSMFLPRKYTTRTLAAMASMAIVVVLMLPWVIRPMVGRMNQKQVSNHSEPSQSVSKASERAVRGFTKPPKQLPSNPATPSSPNQSLSSPTPSSVPPPPPNRPKTNQDLPKLSIEDRSIQEGNSGVRDFSILVELSKPSDRQITFSVEVSDGTAKIGSDVRAERSQTITIPAGLPFASIHHLVLGDREEEGDEYYVIRISNPTNATIAKEQAYFTILDDEKKQDPVLISIADVTVEEPDRNPSARTAAISLSRACDQSITCTFGLRDLTEDERKALSDQEYSSADLAKATEDFEPLSMELTIPPGQTEVMAPIRIMNDKIDEADEIFRMEITNVVNATVERSKAIATIRRNQSSQPTLTIEDAEMVEGDEGTKTLAFKVTLSEASDKMVRCDFATAPGTATDPEDFLQVAGEVWISAGQLSTTASIQINGDQSVELSEWFFVNLSNPTNATLARSQARGTILNDDAYPELIIEDTSMAEGNFSESPMKLIARLSKPYPLPIQVDFSTESSQKSDPAAKETIAQADAKSDFIPLQGVLHFLPGETEQTLAVLVRGDTQHEPDESIWIRLSKPQHVTLKRDLIRATIENDDKAPEPKPEDEPLPKLSVKDTQALEGNAAGQVATFAITLSKPARKEVQFDVITKSGTAVEGKDFLPVSKRVTIISGASETSVSVPIVSDLQGEPSEAFSLFLAGSVGAEIERGIANGVILDDDDGMLSIEDSKVEEGDDGITKMPVRIRLSEPAKQDVTFRLTSGPDSSADAEDFAAVDDKLTIVKGERETIFAVLIHGDKRIEPDERVSLQISEPKNATIARGTAQATIINDDLPKLSITGTDVQESDDGQVESKFIVSLSEPSSEDIEVAVRTFDGTAVQGKDYIAKQSVLKIPAGEVQAEWTVLVQSDTLAELDETLEAKLTNPVRAAIQSGNATCTIIDNDLPSISLRDEATEEGDSGTKLLRIEAELSSASRFEVTVNYVTSNKSATGNDFRATAGKLKINPGELKAGFDVEIFGDKEVEGDEIFGVKIDKPVNATINRSEAEGKIINDDVEEDQPILISIADATIKEPTQGNTIGGAVISLSRASESPVSFEFSLRELTDTEHKTFADPDRYAGLAKAVEDFESGLFELTIPAGQTELSAPIRVFADSAEEQDELILMQLSNIRGAKANRNTAIATIQQNKSSGPTIAIQDAEISEGNDGVTTLSFKVTLSEISKNIVTCEFASSPGSATEKDDFTPIGASISIPAGQLETSASVQIVGDLLVEPKETILINLSNPSNATIERSQALLTILNDDEYPKLSIEDASILEGNAGDSPIPFVARLSKPYPLPIQVEFATVTDVKLEPNDTETIKYADPESDFAALTGVLRFRPEEVEQTFTVLVHGDKTYEQNEMIVIRLTNPQHATLARDLIRATVENDDEALPLLSVADTQIQEGNVNGQVATFVVTLSKPSQQDVSFNAVTEPDTAVDDDDFRPIAKRCKIAAGKLETQVTVPIVSDLNGESNESFRLVLMLPAWATIDRGVASGLIIDDDDPILSIEDSQIEEGNDGETKLPVRIRLSMPAKEDVSVRLASGRDSTADRDDFIAIDERISIAKGESEIIYSILVKADRTIERNETVQLQISEPRNATISKSTGLVTIINDDWPQLSIEGDDYKEPDDKQAEGNFEIMLSEPGLEDIEVTVATVDGTALAGQDFSAAESVIKIPAGEVRATWPVFILGDKVAELDETFEARLTNPLHATLKKSAQICTIYDNDFPVISVGDATIVEGDAGVKLLRFDFQLSSASGLDVSTKYRLLAESADEKDFVNSEGILKFQPGQSSIAIDVEILGDVEVEQDEVFKVFLYEPINATLERSKTTGTIVNDDAYPKLSIANSKIAEGNQGKLNMEFQITLDKPALRFIPLSFKINPIENGASIDKDCFMPNVNFGIGAGQTNYTLCVEVVGDLDVEPDEAFELEIIEAVGAIIEKGKAIGTILNDDQEPPRPILTIDDANVEEGNSATRPIEFTLHLSEVSTKEITLKVATGGGTAQPGTDYQGLEKTWVIPANTLTSTISIDIICDTQRESDESFVVQLSDLVGAVFHRDQATGIIRDDDQSEEDGIEDEFDWGLDRPLAMTPLSVVKLQTNYKPHDGAIYLRGLAYSRLDRQHFVRGQAYDQDVFWQVPSEPIGTSDLPPLTKTLTDISYDMYWLTQQAVFACIAQPNRSEPRDNPVPDVFTAAFRNSARVTRNLSEKEVYSSWASLKADHSAWDDATRKHYLQLPSDDRFQKLANQISNRLLENQRTSSIAKMLAIRQWMQSNLTYDYNAAHAEAEDPTASFLFGDRRGYCVHLAHSMAMLLRCQGIPSRVATGYRVDATRLGQRYGFVIYASDAHAWAEMYLDGIGWVVAETGTKGRIPAADPEPDPREVDYYLGLIDGVPPEVYANNNISLTRAAAVGGATTAGVGLFALYIAKFWRLLVPLLVGVASMYRLGYRAILDRLSQVGLRREHGETWDEFAERIQPIVPAFAELTDIHLGRSYGGREFDLTRWRALERSVKQQLRSKTKWTQRWIGWIHPLNWRGVG